MLISWGSSRELGKNIDLMISSKLIETDEKTMSFNILCLITHIIILYCAPYIYKLEANSNTRGKGQSTKVHVYISTLIPGNIGEFYISPIRRCEIYAARQVNILSSYPINGSRRRSEEASWGTEGGGEKRVGSGTWCSWSQIKATSRAR